MPIIHRRQLLGVLVVQQRELRQFDESEESFMVTLATQMAGILSQSQLNAIFGQYRQTRVRALAASPGVAVAEGWQDSSQPSLDQVYRASTLDTGRHWSPSASNTVLCDRRAPAPVVACSAP